MAIGGNKRRSPRFQRVEAEYLAACERERMIAEGADPEQIDKQQQRAKYAQRKLEEETRFRDVTRLKVAGYTYAAIAKELELPGGERHVRYLWAKAVKSVAHDDKRESLVKYELRHDMALRTLSKIMLNDKAKDADRVQAAAKLLDAEARRLTVFGHIAPTQHRHGGDKNAPPIQTQHVQVLTHQEIAEMTDEQLAEARAAADAAVARAVAGVAAGPGVGAATAGADIGG